MPGAECAALWVWGPLTRTPNSHWPNMGKQGKYGDIHNLGNNVHAANEIRNMEITKFKIRSTTNVGKVWITRKKSSRPHVMPFQAIFPWAENKEIVYVSLIFLGGPRANWGKLSTSMSGTSIGSDGRLHEMIRARQLQRSRSDTLVDLLISPPRADSSKECLFAHKRK